MIDPPDPMRVLALIDAYMAMLRFTVKVLCILTVIAVVLSLLLKVLEPLHKLAG